MVAGARDERVRRAAQVAPFLEEREEALTQLGGRAHPGFYERVAEACAR